MRRRSFGSGARFCWEVPELRLRFLDSGGLLRWSASAV